MRPDSLPLLLKLAGIHAVRGEVEAARHAYAQVLTGSPDSIEAMSGMGSLLAANGQYEEAATFLIRAFESAPRIESIRLNLVNVLRELGQLGQATRLLNEAIDRDPELDGVRTQLLRLFAEQGRYDQALTMLRSVLRARPGKLDVANNLAALLAACPDAQVRNPSEAIAIAEWLCGQSRAQDARHLFTLSVAYMAAERPDDAIRAGERALSVATAHGQAALATTIGARLAAFRAAAPGGMPSKAEP